MEVKIVFNGSSSSISDKVYIFLAKLSGNSISELKTADHSNPVIFKKSYPSDKITKLLEKLTKLGLHVVAKEIKELEGKAETKSEEAQCEIELPVKHNRSLSAKVDSFSKLKLIFLTKMLPTGFIFMLTSFGILILILSTLFLENNSDIKLVKSGALPNFPNNQIGPMFDEAFDGGEWESFFSSRGVRVVRFTGKVSEDLHKEAIESIGSSITSAVQLNSNFNYVLQQYYSNPDQVNLSFKEHFSGDIDYLIDKIESIAKTLNCLPKEKSNSSFPNSFHFSCPQRSQEEKLDAEINKAYNLTKNKFIFPEGLKVTFDFSVNTAGKTFELSGINPEYPQLVTLSRSEFYNIITLENVE